MLKTKHKTPNKHYDCIHRGKKPYPVCPKCDGYWGGYLNPKRPMCMLCDYKPSQEELSILTQTKDMYAKQKKDNEIAITENKLRDDSFGRYIKLNKLLLDNIKGSGLHVLELTQAVQIAKNDVEKFIK